MVGVTAWSVGNAANTLSHMVPLLLTMTCKVSVSVPTSQMRRLRLAGATVPPVAE